MPEPLPLSEKDELIQSRAEKAKAKYVEAKVNEASAICQGAIPKSMLFQIASDGYANYLKSQEEKPADKAKQ